MPTPRKKPRGAYAKNVVPRGPKLSVYVAAAAKLRRVECLGPEPRPKGCDGTVMSDGPAHRMCGSCRGLRDARLRTYSPTAFAPAADAPAELQ